MYLLKRHFLRGPPTKALTDDRPRLPTEILIHISSFVRHRSDIITLCRVSKIFSSIYIPLLYRVVTIGNGIQPAKSTSQLRLYQMLRDPFISSLVTHLEVDLKGGEFCNKWSRSRILPSYFTRCSCSGQDAALERAIVILRNLESLLIHCTLCSGDHSHDYLFHLEVPQLRQFRFRCSASRYKPSLKKSALLLPFMPQITELSLECNDNYICPNEGELHKLLVERSDVAPKLHTLSFNGALLPKRLLARRPVQRLCLNDLLQCVLGRHIEGLHDTLVQSPGKLSHLFAIDILQWLPNAIQRNVEPYRHLRYIGTITMLRTEDVRRFEMENLAPLCNLEVMEINRLRMMRTYYNIGVPVNPDRMFHPARRFLEILGDRHPLLRRVLLTCRHRYQSEINSTKGVEPTLWEKIDGQPWNPRPVPHLEYWELLHDKLDEF